MLTIVRGLPGSGKSTYAKSLGCFHVEADMYHMRGETYQWSGDRVKEAHQWCKEQVTQAVKLGIDVVVSNTFTQNWEFKAYIEIAEAYRVPYRVVRCTGQYGNVHSVPEEILIKMSNRFEKYAGEVLV